MATKNLKYLSFQTWCYDHMRNNITHVSNNFGGDTYISDQSVNDVKRRNQTGRGDVKFCMISQNKDFFCALDHLTFDRNLFREGTGESMMQRYTTESDKCLIYVELTQCLLSNHSNKRIGASI